MIPDEPRVRVFLCDDTDAFRLLMRLTLADDPGIEVVGEAADGAAGVEGVGRTAPDVVLLDAAMPGLDGLQAARLIRRAAPATQIVGLSAFASEQLAGPMRDAGASAYLEKGADLHEITAAIHRVHREAAPLHRLGR